MKPRPFRPRLAEPVIVPPRIWPGPQDNKRVLRMCSCRQVRTIGRREIFFTLLWAAFNVLRHRHARATLCSQDEEHWLFIGWYAPPS